MRDYELASGAVVRIAGWPLEDIERFGLGEDVGTATRHSACSMSDAEFEQWYATQLERDRAHLWEVTAASPRFRAALALCSASLSRSLRSTTPPAKRNKAVRHIETSLYRYLSRAVFRTEPLGLWTEVGTATWGEGSSSTIRSGPPTAHVRPELSPFRRLFDSLAEHPANRARVGFRLNPTLRRDDEGRWTYAARNPKTGATAWRAAPATPWFSTVIETLERGTATLADTRNALKILGTPLAVEALVQLLLDRGLLVSTWAFPNRFEEPFDALRQAEGSLEGDLRNAWTGARESLEKTCRGLEKTLDAVLRDEVTAPDAVVGAIEAATSAVLEVLERMAAACGSSDVERPSTPLRVDLSCGSRIELGRIDRGSIESLFDQWEELERAHDGPQRWRARLGGLGLEPGGTSICDPRTDSSRTEARCHVSDEHGGQGPASCALIVRSTGASWERGRVMGMSPVPTATHARHAYHLAHRGDPLLAWFQGRYRHLEENSGLEVVELSFEHEGSPNVLARPSYTRRTLDPWRGQSSVRLESGARLVRSNRGRALFLEQDGERFVAQVFTAVVPPRDAVIRRLMATTYDARCRPGEAESESEQAQDAGAPSKLPGGARVTMVRTKLASQEVQWLAESRGIERHRLWLRLARRYAWDRFVRVSRARRPGLVVVTDSPIAVDAAFEGLQPEDEVVVEEVCERGWWKGVRGHHLTELVVPAARRTHAWMPEEGEQGPRCSLEAHDWTQVLVTFGRDEQGRASVRSFFEALEDLRVTHLSPADIPMWFVRKRPGVRLRVGTRDPRIRIELESILETERRAGRIVRWAWAVYEPEEALLGGKSVLPVVHRFLSSHASLWAAWSADEGAGGRRADASSMTAALCHDLIGRGTEDWAEAWGVWYAMARSYGALPSELGAPRPVDDRALDEAFRGFATIKDRRILALAKATNEQLSRAIERAWLHGRLGRGPRTLWATLCAFCWNMWGLSSPQITGICRMMVGSAGLERTSRGART